MGKTTYKSPFTNKWFIDGVKYDRPIIDAREDNDVTTLPQATWWNNPEPIIFDHSGIDGFDSMLYSLINLSIIKDPNKIFGIGSKNDPGYLN